MLCRFCFGFLLLVQSVNPSLAEMTKATSRSAGSFFAAAASCEESGKIQNGQTQPLLKRMDRFLSANNKRWLQQGFKTGAERSSVFIPRHGWMPVSSNDSDCYRVQSIFDDYKSHLE
jgi:hypothetical protein